MSHPPPLPLLFPTNKPITPGPITIKVITPGILPTIANPNINLVNPLLFPTKIGPASPKITPTVPVSPNTFPKVTPTVPSPNTFPKVTPTVPSPNTFPKVAPMLFPNSLPKVTPTIPITIPNTFPKVATIKIATPIPPQIKTLVINKPKAVVPGVELITDDTIVELAINLDKVAFDQLLSLIDDYYHNGEALISDETYDELIDMYESKFGKYLVVGAEPKGEKVDLPYYLGSLRKIKKENELTNWIGSYPGPYIVEDKIDGLTLLFVSKLIGGRRVNSLYTRGGGYRGVDVSHLLSYMKFPVITHDIAVRGEVVFTKDTFLKVGAGFKNARNMVSGIVNSKKQFDPNMAQLLSFYAYRIMNKNNTAESDVVELHQLGFNIPNPVSFTSINKEELENYFKTRKEQAPYEVDGLVIYHNVAGIYPIGETPKHVVAFKTGTETGVTTVIGIVWEASKNRLLKPVIHYEPITLSGAELQKASGYNARFIINNNIGPGAKILLTRSGDVIPRVLSVITPSPAGPTYPDINIHGSYHWNDNQVELVLDTDNDEVLANKLFHFINTIGIKGFGPQRIRTLIQAGIKDIITLLSVTSEQLAGIPGIGPLLSHQLVNDLQEKVTNVSIAKIMDASGIFPNIGERRFEAILEVIPNLLKYANSDPQQVIHYIQTIKGFNMLAIDIVKNLPVFVSWLNQHPMITLQDNTPKTTVVQGNQNLQGSTIVFSGFRDKDLEANIKSRGGKVTTAVSKNTTFLVLKDLSPENMKGKAQDAQAKGVKLISREDFITTYLQ